MLKSFQSNRKKVNFAIVTEARSGSNLLHLALHRHPFMWCWGECLHPNQGITPKGKDVDGATIMSTAYGPSLIPDFIGGTLHVTQPVEGYGRWKNAWEWLSTRTDIKIIYLRRRDRLARFLSLQIVAETGEWIRYSEDQSPRAKRPKIKIDPKKYKKLEKCHNKLWDEKVSLLRDHPSIDVYYEDLTRDWEEETRKIQEFIGVPYRPLEQATVKQEARDIREVVKNPHELEEFL